MQQSDGVVKDGANRDNDGERSIMSLGQELAPHLPFLRRYARALTGSQAHGDAFVRATLEAIVAKPDEFPRDVDPRLGGPDAQLCRPPLRFCLELPVHVSRLTAVAFRRIAASLTPQ